MGHRAEIEAGVAPQIIHRAASGDLDLTDAQVGLILLPALSESARKGPYTATTFAASELGRIAALMAGMKIPDDFKLVLVGEPQAIVAAHPFLQAGLKFHHWIAAKKEPSQAGYLLPAAHVGLSIYSTAPRLAHAKVRLAYQICPACGNTTKDYGGKKHIRGTDYGTLMSDVWKDVLAPAVGLDPESESRVLDFLSTPGVERMVVVDATKVANLPPAISAAKAAAKMPPIQAAPAVIPTIDPSKSVIVTGDCLEVMPQMPDNSVDLIFLDPPYNLDKPYASYDDDLGVEDYFTWCDKWLEESVRVLKPGGSLVIINIPLGSIRHALYLNQRLTFQNWIAWDALSQPRGYIMPAHYPLIWYTKGEPTNFELPSPTGEEYSSVLGRPDGLCLRGACVRKRAGKYPGQPLTDLWTDIFRVLHNSQRLDHPCILPVKVMRRIVALFSPADGIVFDPFNGVGTTTLSADLEGRGYLGVEMDPPYAEVTRRRHEVIAQGGDPFAKNTDRQKRVTLEVPKKKLQLEVLRVAQILGHIPTRAELEEHSTYPLATYDKVLKNGYELTGAAAREGFKKAK
jgi:site-specific DNA-methyltransferase (adenine-specific)